MNKRMLLILLMSFLLLFSACIPGNGSISDLPSQVTEAADPDAEASQEILTPETPAPAQSTIPETPAQETLVPVTPSPAIPVPDTPVPEAPSPEEASTSEATVVMDDSQQYEANIFLSNFAEAIFPDYDADAPDWNALIVFAHLHLKLNSPKDIVYQSQGEETYETITLERMNQVFDRYFNKSVPQSAAESFSQYGGFYKDGRFYFPASDGEAHNALAIVDRLVLLPDGTFRMDFTRYEMDLDTYFDKGITKSDYSMTSAQASASGKLSVIGSGTATAVAKKVNGRDSYALLSYTRK